MHICLVSVKYQSTKWKTFSLRSINKLHHRWTQQFRKIYINLNPGSPCFLFCWKLLAGDVLNWRSKYSGGIFLEKKDRDKYWLAASKLQDDLRSVSNIPKTWWISSAGYLNTHEIIEFTGDSVALQTTHLSLGLRKVSVVKSLAETPLPPLSSAVYSILISELYV